MNINKTCLDGTTFSSFISLLSISDQNFFSDKIKDILDNSYAFIRGEHEAMNEENPDWEKLISQQQHLTDNFDLIYANYFLKKNKKDITYDFNIILKCKTMPFVAWFLFNTEPDNFCDKNDLDIFPNTESALVFFDHFYYKETVEKSINDYEILQRHLLINNRLGSKKDIKTLKI